MLSYPLSAIETVRRAVPLPTIVGGLAALVVGLATSEARAADPTVDGVSVTTHWQGHNDLQYGGYGEIWRHEIEGGEAVAHTRIFAGPARNPVISPDGTRVAFIRQDGMIAVMPLRGGEGGGEDDGGRTLRELAQTHGEAHIDWPLGDWVYFNLGGYHQYGTSRFLRRVNARTGVDEPVVTFNRGSWRFAISSDLRRAVLRVDDEPVEPWGRIVAYDMVGGGGKLRLDRATDRFSCSLGIDPSGEYFLDGWAILHDGMDIRRWDDLQIVGALTHAQASEWGGPDSGTGHNLNNWSVNSSKWISVHLGWGLWGSTGANQVLYNLRDRQRIVITDNGPGSHRFDSSGDFWVSGAGPTAGELMPPSLQRGPHARDVEAGQVATFSVSASSGDPTATTYQWLRDGAPIPGADGASYTTAPTGPADHGARFACHVTNAHGEVCSAEAALRVHPVGTLENQPPVVDAGLDSRAVLGRPVLLVGSATDDRLAAGELRYLWEQLEGPQQAKIARPDAPRTLFEADQPGIYRFRLTVDDGALRGVAEVSILQVEERSIRLLAPNGGEVWQVGSTQEIRWETEGVVDVAIHLSLDDGQSWEAIEPSIDTGSPQWGRYRWTVPDRPSTGCRIAISSYADSSNETRSAAAFTIQPAQGPPAPFADRPDDPPPATGGCAIGGEGSAASGGPALLLALIFLATVRRRQSPPRA